MDAAHEHGETSRVWRTVFRLVFRTPRPVLGLAKRVRPSGPIQEFRIVGRRTGLERRYLLTLLEVDGRWYVGHPNGHSQWIRNLLAANSAVVMRRNVETSVRAIELETGPERDAAIAAASRQPFPAGRLYGGARRHITATGVYLRLEPIES